MKKRIVVMLLCGILCVTNTGCGCGCGSENPPTDSTTVTKETEITEETDTEVAETVETIETVETETAEESAPETVEEIKEDELSVGDIARDTFVDVMDNIDTTKKISTNEIANLIIEQTDCPFEITATTVEPGLLEGFQSEIDGFSSGTMIFPVDKTIPYLGYVFKVEGDMDEFEQNLCENSCFLNYNFDYLYEENENSEWPAYIRADEMLTKTSGDYIYFLLCMSSFNE